MRNVTYRRAATGFSKFNRNYFVPLTPSTNAQVISDMGTFSFPMIDGNNDLLLIDGRAHVATEGNWKCPGQ